MLGKIGGERENEEKVFGGGPFEGENLLVLKKKNNGFDEGGVKILKGGRINLLLEKGKNVS